MTTSKDSLVLLRKEKEDARWSLESNERLGTRTAETPLHTHMTSRIYPCISTRNILTTYTYGLSCVLAAIGKKSAGMMQSVSVN